MIMITRTFYHQEGSKFQKSKSHEAIVPVIGKYDDDHETNMKMVSMIAMVNMVNVHHQEDSRYQLP